METDTFTVTEVAEQIGISPTSVRRLANSLAPHLSDGARQRPRTFTQTDLDRLQAASRLKASQVASSATLETATLPAAMPVLAAPAAQPPMWADLQHRLAAVERAQHDNHVVIYLNGMTSGVVLMGVLFLVAWLLVNGA